MSGGAAVVLNVDCVCSGYPGLPVLFDVTLDLREGELLTVLGANGAGKSTLLKTILGDVAVSSGEVVFRGQRITTLPTHRRVAAGISYSPEGRRVFPHLSVVDNLVAGSFGIASAEVAAQVQSVSELFPILGERQHQQAGSLSGGEQQMLAIARALMSRPRLLMVEELSLGLAPVVVTGLYEALRAMCASGLAVVVAEQFQCFEPDYSDRWMVLERGAVIAAGGRDEAEALRPVARGY